MKRGTLFTLGLLAFTAQYNGEFEKAAALASDCYRLAIDLNAPRPLAYCKEVFGLIAYAQDDLSQACQLFQEAIDLFEKVGDRRNVASAKINLARTLYRQGDLEAAFRYIDDSLSISRELTIRWTLGLGLEISGLLERSRFHDETALALFQESLLIALDQDNQQGVANCLGAIAGLAVIANKAVEAAILFAAADKIRKEIGAGMGSGDQQEYDCYLTLTRQHLTEDEFKTAWAHGAELTLEQLVTLTKIEPSLSVLEIISHMEVMNEA